MMTTKANVASFKGLNVIAPLVLGLILCQSALGLDLSPETRQKAHDLVAGIEQQNPNAQRTLAHWFEAFPEEDLLLATAKEAEMRQNKDLENATGTLLLLFTSMDEDQQRAAYWWTMTDSNVKPALPLTHFTLSVLYARGIGTPLDQEKAKVHRQLSCEAGFEPACTP